MRIATWSLVALPVLMLGSLIKEGISEQHGRSQGIADANRDIEAGELGLKGSGKPMYWCREYRNLLSTQYNIKYEHVAGCISTSYQHGYIFSYNETMQPHLAQREIDLDQIAAIAKSRADAQRDNQ